MTRSLQNWIELGAAIVAWIYLETLWKRHSDATLNLPERRTLYDFLHTHPRAFYAFFILMETTVDLIRARF